MDRRAFLAASAALLVTGAVAAGLPAETGDETLLRLGEELDRAWAREKALIDSKTWGDAYAAAFNARDEIVDRIEKHQAHTLEGLRVNGHVQAVLTLDEWTDFDMLELDQGGSPPRCQNQQVVQANSQ